MEIKDYPNFEAGLQRELAKARKEGYDLAKANIQFPVCACKFADDEETLLAPCQAHLLWKKEQIFAFLRVLRKHYDEAIKKKPFQVDKDVFITTLERSIFEAEKELGLL